MIFEHTEYNKEEPKPDALSQSHAALLQMRNVASKELQESEATLEKLVAVVRAHRVAFIALDRACNAYEDAFHNSPKEKLSSPPDLAF